MSTAIDQEVLGVRVESRPLPFPVSQALLPEALTFVTRAVELIGKIGDILATNDVAKLLGALDPVAASELTTLLVKHDRKLLARTIVTMPSPSGELERYDLANERDRTYVFESRPDLFVPLCVVAGRVTFERFFPASVLPVGEARPLS